MLKKRASIIFNPKAGNGKGKRIISAIKNSLEQKYGMGNVSFYVTKNKNDACKLAFQSQQLGCEKIISVGGDGTVHEIINGINMGNSSNIPKIGMINYGTGADLNRSLDLPHSFKDRLALILSDKEHKIDLGQITYNGKQGKEKKYFINECQVGIGGNVVKQVSNLHKLLGGKMAFGLVTAKNALFYKAKPLHYSFNDNLPCNDILYGMVIGNGSFCGGGMKLTPNAKMNDQKLDLLLVHNMPLFTRLKELSKTYSGKHIYSSHFSNHQITNINIESETSIYVSSDGEFLGNTPCEIKIVPHAISMIK